jgi:phosphoribosylamine-glycine ligase
MEEIVLRTAHAMVSEGCPFRGVLSKSLVMLLSLVIAGDGGDCAAYGTRYGL